MGICIVTGSTGLVGSKHVVFFKDCMQIIEDNDFRALSLGGMLQLVLI